MPKCFAITKANEVIGSWRLEDCIMYVTLDLVQCVQEQSFNLEFQQLFMEQKILKVDVVEQFIIYLMNHSLIINVRLFQVVLEERVW